ncbi:MAG TPA: ParB N-terminal domain-containing protein, partial [Saprospiraceae bacterium]|nr:ParB N-terminal domain-containing protein [Saprospiraceae bacterium]
MFNWHLEILPIKDLKEHSKNPRQITKDQFQHLKGLIAKFGLIDKPIVNKDWTIIGGHQRIKVLKKMKAKTVECWVPDDQLEQEDIDHLCIGLNLNQGSFDYDILANQWDACDLLKWGFTEEQLLGEQIKEIESTEEDDQSLQPCKDEDAITKLGDLYILGNHRLICGDSTLPEVVEKVMGGNEPILMVTDPPYGVEYDPNNRNKAKGRLGAVIAKGKVLNDNIAAWALAYFLFPGSIAYVWHGSLHSPIVHADLVNCGFDVVGNIIWAKQHFTLGR